MIRWKVNWSQNILARSVAARHLFLPLHPVWKWNCCTDCCPCSKALPYLDKSVNSVAHQQSLIPSSSLTHPNRANGSNEPATLPGLGTVALVTGLAQRQFGIGLQRENLSPIDYALQLPDRLPALSVFWIVVPDHSSNLLAHLLLVSPWTKGCASG